METRDERLTHGFAIANGMSRGDNELLGALVDTLMKCDNQFRPEEAKWEHYLRHSLFRTRLTYYRRRSKRWQFQGEQLIEESQNDLFTAEFHALVEGVDDPVSGYSTDVAAEAADDLHEDVKLILDSLSEKELQVLTGIRQKKNQAQIAADLGISQQMVSVIKSTISKKVEALQ